MNFFTAPAFFSGLLLSLSLIMAIGPQNAHVMRMGLQRQHLWLTIAVCVTTDMAMIAAGVGGLAQLGGLSGVMLNTLTGLGALVLLLYGGQALRRFVWPPAQPVAAAGALPASAEPVSRRRAIALATQASRVTLENGTAPPVPALPEADTSDMDYFLGQLQIVLPVLGVNAIRVRPTKPPVPPLLFFQ